MRQLYPPRTIRLVGEVQRQTAINALRNAPIDADKPLEVVIREERKVRKPEANAAMWAGLLKDISEQAWIEGRRFSAEVWHEHLKREFLPEGNEPDFDELVREGYRKWDVLPSGERVLVGSTTQLTVKGFRDYLIQVEAYGAELGVMFTERAA